MEMSQSSVVLKFKLVELKVLEENEEKFRIELQTSSTLSPPRNLKIRLVNTYQEHYTSVLSVCFSPDDEYAVSGSKDGSIKLWDIHKQRSIKTFTEHASSVNSVFFSPDGEYIISGSDDTTIKLWDVKTGKCVKTFEGHKGFVNSVCFSKDGKFVISGSSDGTIRFWAVETGECIEILKEHKGAVTSVSVSSSGKYLVSGSFDGTIKIWDIDTRKCVSTSENYDILINFANFSPDDKFILFGDSRTLIVWNVEKEKRERIFSENEDRINCACFSPNGKYILSCGHTPRLIDINTGEYIKNFEKEYLKIYNKFYNIYSVTFSSDGKYALLGHGDGTISLWYFDWNAAEEISNLTNEDIILYLEIPLSSYKTYELKKENLLKIFEKLGKQGNGLLEPENRNVHQTILFSWKLVRS
jgi:WD40 repeat protein